MDKHLKSIDERLEALRLATEGIQPTPGFEGRVLAAIGQRSSSDWRASIWRVGRYGLLVSVAAVALATLFALKGASQADELQALTYGTVELEW